MVQIPMSQALQDKALQDNMAHVRHVLFVMSGKGGVGKSSITVNLAVALASFGYRIGILDVDVHGPSIPALLGFTGKITAEKDKIIPAQVHGISAVSMGMLVDKPDTAILWRGSRKAGVIRQLLSTVQWGELDMLCIDSPPGTGDEPITVLSALPHAISLVVTSPQSLSVGDVRRALDMLRRTKAPILGLVENMSNFVCPHCHTSTPVFGDEGGRKLAEELDLPFLGSIPLDPATGVAAEQGIPVVLWKDATPAKQALLDLARRVREDVL